MLPIVMGIIFLMLPLLPKIAEVRGDKVRAVGRVTAVDEENSKVRVEYKYNDEIYESDYDMTVQKMLSGYPPVGLKVLTIIGKDSPEKILSLIIKVGDGKVHRRGEFVDYSVLKTNLFMIGFGSFFLITGILMILFP